MLDCTGCTAAVTDRRRHRPGAGFSVVILGASEPLAPGEWQENEQPAFLLEVSESLSLGGSLERLEDSD